MQKRIIRTQEDFNEFSTLLDKLASINGLRPDGPIPTKQRNPDRLAVEKLTGPELIERAKKWNEERKKSAANEFIFWNMMVDGTLSHKFDVVKAEDGTETPKTYQCDDVQRFEGLPGTAVFTGCDCKDQETHLQRIKKAMRSAGVDEPVFCKHHYIRLLWAGHTIRVNGWSIRIKDSLFKA